ncbi:MAG: glutamine--fructose-6-phosphate transaminase (isomerizing) [Holosporales bacterium]|jgi:glucosamine--fructose-6-phosphate aminotransferase (isomerizing)|nr:glutamine--fructose-6-phosphate transaminase (isomerizing) [Holosporales bacterium]
MCGIISILSKKDDVIGDLIASLRKLEYRGYDSAGISYIDDNSVLQTIKTIGKIEVLEDLVTKNQTEGVVRPPSKPSESEFLIGDTEHRSVVQQETDYEELGRGSIGIGHTRWATHGKVSPQNAHPHTSNGVAIVHNGIIENYRELKNSLIRDNFEFDGESDSEVIAKLISNHLKNGLEFIDAFKNTIAQLSGTFAIVAIYDLAPNIIIGTKRGAPMTIGLSNDKLNFYIASDAIALSTLCDEISYLEEGDYVICEKSDQLNYRILTENWESIERDKVQNTISMADVGKNGFEDFMMKEISEEPIVIDNMITQFNCDFDISHYRSIYIIACGTSFYAGLLSKYWIEEMAGIHVDVEIASEFRYRNLVSPKDSLYVFISQSGETIDTLAAMRKANQLGLDTLSIVNVDSSSIAREAGHNLKTLAGFEIGVASTKSFIAQAMAMLMLTIKKNNLDVRIIKNIMHSILLGKDKIKVIAEKIKDSKSMLYMGRGCSYPIALEGALKMKELSYISAEGYPSGETKHGPIAMIDSNVYSIVIAPFDRYFDKTLSNTQEILARHGPVIFLTTDRAIPFIEDLENNNLADCIIFHEDAVPQENQTDELLRPLSFAMAVHLLAYYTAKAKGLDADKPRNLAKSVTVE